MIRHRTTAHPFARTGIDSTQAGKPGFGQPEGLVRAVGGVGAGARSGTLWRGVVRETTHPTP
ncbi:hypothetical protein [uncultured Marivita sp.]|uniref:hypothetical protein n=1 Tax=uncultured Marivita sp. TaxID=888080 RepID=UPI0025FB6F90|nr:hypothetical protein [uncultured Marivita sp.]MCR9108488.1 hypothetical protein [Paracoccaceae bacterium]